MSEATPWATPLPALFCDCTYLQRHKEREVPNGEGKGAWHAHEACASDLQGEDLDIARAPLQTAGGQWEEVQGAAIEAGGALAQGGPQVDMPAGPCLHQIWRRVKNPAQVGRSGPTHMDGQPFAQGGGWGKGVGVSSLGVQADGQRTAQGSYEEEQLCPSDQEDWPDLTAEDEKVGQGKVR